MRTQIGGSFSMSIDPDASTAPLQGHGSRRGSCLPCVLVVFALLVLLGCESRDRNGEGKAWWIQCTDGSGTADRIYTRLVTELEARGIRTSVRPSMEQLPGVRPPVLPGSVWERGWVLGIPKARAQAAGKVARGCPVHSPDGALVGYVEDLAQSRCGGVLVFVGQRVRLARVHELLERVHVATGGGALRGAPSMPEGIRLLAAYGMGPAWLGREVTLAIRDDFSWLLLDSDLSRGRPPPGEWGTCGLHLLRTRASPGSFYGNPRDNYVLTREGGRLHASVSRRTPIGYLGTSQPPAPGAWIELRVADEVTMAHVARSSVQEVERVVKVLVTRNVALAHRSPALISLTGTMRCSWNLESTRFEDPTRWPWVGSGLARTVAASLGNYWAATKQMEEVRVVLSLDS